MAKGGMALPRQVEAGRSPTATRRRPRPSVKQLLFGLVALCLAGAVGFAISQELGTPAAQPSARPVLGTPRPALSADEQQYVQALWPIHGDVERTSELVALGAIFYKTGDLGREEFKQRLDQAQLTYREDEQKLRALQPPASFQARHDQYLTALQLFEQSDQEMAKLFEDGSEDHLLAAVPAHQAGTDKIREVGYAFWPDEFPPN
jgi:hypothetical protein